MSIRRSSLAFLILLALLLAALGACSTATPRSETIIQTQIVTEQVIATQAAPQPTAAPAAVDTSAPTTTAVAPAAEESITPPQQATPVPLVTPAANLVVEERLVELEWPTRMRLGDSDLVRLSLVPSKDGYVIVADFPEHPVVTQTVQIQRPGDYDLSAVARLDGIGFSLSPAGEQAQALPEGQPVTWRWTLTPHAAGLHRLSVTLTLRWTPVAGISAAVREVQVYSHPLEIRVTSFFGMTRNQALMGGFLGLFFGSGMGFMAFVTTGKAPRKALQVLAPNAALAIEPRPGLVLHHHEETLLRALFQRYARLTLESEFLSGYSGARTFLAQPIRPDGRADAHTIVKIGERGSIEREYQNYEAYVKDTLPPATARIQHVPVSVRATQQAAGRAALQYTFIGAPGQPPRSLRQALLETPDPAYLRQLFETFGPNWWMQRRPYTFRAAVEYDRLLPAHLILEPLGNLPAGVYNVLDGSSAAATLGAGIGDVLTLQNFRPAERRADGKSLSLLGAPAPGQPALRLRWLGLSDPNGHAGQVVATRETLLQSYTAGYDLFGLPDPLKRLPALLNESIRGSQSTIHGDLNLENILLGPGGLVWLIDFAQTRDGHPLYDFAHLEAEIIAHICAARLPSAGEYAAWLAAPETHADLHALRQEMHGITDRLLANPTQGREYQLALFLACLGALKYTNLDAHARQVLYLTAAHIAQSL